MKRHSKESGATNWNKIFKTHRTDKILVSRIYKEFSQINKKQRNSSIES